LVKTTVSSKGQIVLPAELRQRDQIEPGQEFGSNAWTAATTVWSVGLLIPMRGSSIGLLIVLIRLN